MSEKRKVRFTFIDALVILVILAVVIFVGSKFFSSGDTPFGTSSTQECEISFFIEESPDFAATLVKEGDPLTDEARDISLGTITKVELSDSVVYSANDKGEMVKSSKEGYKSVKLTAKLNAEKSTHGIKISGTSYVVGHTMTIYAGGAKLYGKISAIK